MFKWSIKTPNATFRLTLDGGRIKRQADKWAKRWLGRIGGYTRRVARSSIKKKGGARPPAKTEAAKRRRRAEDRKRTPSPPGKPPFTWTGALRDAIRYEVDLAGQTVIIGTSAFDVDELGMFHEKAKRRFGRRYPARPFMQPALEKAVVKIRADSRSQVPPLWSDSVKV